MPVTAPLWSPLGHGDLHTGGMWAQGHLGRELCGAGYRVHGLEGGIQVRRGGVPLWSWGLLSS